VGGRPPDSVAVVGPDATHTYAELDRQANPIAHRLLSCGVAPDEPVGVLLEPGAGYVAAALGVLKAGRVGCGSSSWSSARRWPSVLGYSEVAVAPSVRVVMGSARAAANAHEAATPARK
jgi:acyl-CoA synthetase (AMP-forming)/AMP-acid ligase II